jgi:hypothetical protein
LRLLLTMVVGPYFFEDLHTVDSIVHTTFKDVCNPMGLLQNDGEWI